jgi:hypothetical protein
MSSGVLKPTTPHQHDTRVHIYYYILTQTSLLPSRTKIAIYFLTLLFCFLNQRHRTSDPPNPRFRTARPPSDSTVPRAELLSATKPLDFPNLGSEDSDEVG